MRNLGLVAILAVCALPARGDVQIGTGVLNVLTSIDSLPSRSELETAFSRQDPPVLPLDGLEAIIFDDAAPLPPDQQGVQLRAIRSLPQFCTASCQNDQAHALLERVISDYNDPGKPRGPRETLRARAAIEALGVAKVVDDRTILEPFLNNSSRDLRVAAAKALRDLCNTEAIPALRARLTTELVPQVKGAISAALRDLAACSGS